MVLALGVVVLVSACSIANGAEGESLRARMLLDGDWMFHRGDISTNDQANLAGYEDKGWQHVQVPHDYVLDGTYSATNVQKQGYLPLESAWYRKHFVVPEADRGKTLRLEFEGVYRDSEVWLNGQFLGRHRSGYTGFEYDVTLPARYGSENVLAVRVDPRKFEGHWYEGGGIYRHVHLTAMAPVHVATFGTHVVATVPDGSAGAHEKAEITIQTMVENDGATPTNCSVVSEIAGPDGSWLRMTGPELAVGTNGDNETVQHAVIQNPQLWSLESPQLYELRTTVLQDGMPVDSTTTAFGIRTIHFDPDKGFFLNGKRVEILGAACHQDMPAVGIAVPDSLQEWRVRKLKEMGCNGWRTAHNPPNESVIEACDRVGILVMEENRHLGDAYGNHSPTGTTFTNEYDLAWMIQRDRNHPSVIMWSLCNEEGLQGKPEGQRIISAMIDVVHRYDETRPTTSAVNGGWKNREFKPIGDIFGINYHPDMYDQLHETYPETPLFGSETANNKSTRGEYEDDKTNGLVSCYHLTDDGWRPVVERPFMAGSYTWTGFDYKGEPNPFGWPDISNNTGLMDVCGFPKDKYYYLESWWSDKPMVHLMPGSWNWAAGKEIRVIAFSNAGEVELFLNGKSLGIQAMPRNGHVEWQVPFAPGRLRAEGRTDGRAAAMDVIETTGPSARIELSPERHTLHADGVDTIVVPVSILDTQGRINPNADNRVTFKLAGGGKLLGVGNGNPSDHDPDRANQRKAFHGHCVALIQADARPESIELTATSPGLKRARTRFEVR